MMSEEYLNRNVFEQDVRGFLFFVEPTREGQDRARIIFEFNQDVLRKLREGDIVAVESFSTLTPHGEGTFYTLLEITRTNPTHITIDRLKKYRFMGAVREFLKEATKDFEEEDPRLIRDHIYIEAEAENTGYLMLVSGDEFEFKNEASKPISGRDVGVLLPKVVRELINMNVEKGIEIGKLYSTYEEKNVPVLLRPDKLTTHHYSVFGFTGSGKSNFNSIIITRLLERPNLKIIVFDLSDEYTDLLIDKISTHGYVVIDERDVPDSVIRYLENRDEERLGQAAEDLARSSKKPGVFDSEAFIPVYARPFREILQNDRLRIYNPQVSVSVRIQTVQDFLQELERRTTSDRDVSYLRNMIDLIPTVVSERNLTVQNFDEWNISDIEDFEVFIRTLRSSARVHSSSGFYGTIDAVLSRIMHAEEVEETRVPGHYVDLNWVLEQYVTRPEEDPKLCILVSSDKETMISMIVELIHESLELRRQMTRTHDVLFAVDEAHEFVLGGSARPSKSEQASSTTIERLTRMGRKYGLGACIASQRVAYLNTTAISNCHTTFLGSLPRSYDRVAMHTAYAISEDVLSQVVTFPPGNWYAVSVNAMGITNVPIRIVAPNREKELAQFFRDQGYLNNDLLEILRGVEYLD